MRSTFDSTLPWWIAGPIIGLVIVALLALANKRFGVVGGVTDLVLTPGSTLISPAPVSSRCCSGPASSSGSVREAPGAVPPATA